MESKLRYSLIVLCLALFYYQFEFYILCRLGDPVVSLEALSIRNQPERCWSRLPMSNMIQSRLNSMIMKGCDKSKPFPHKIPELDANDFASPDGFCPEIGFGKDINWWEPFVIRNFSTHRRDLEGLLDVWRAMPDLILVRNTTELYSPEYIGRSLDCPSWGRAHKFVATFREYELWNKFHKGVQYYLSFATKFVQEEEVIDEIDHKDFCGMIGQRSELFASFKTEHIPGTPDTPMHSAAKGNAFLQLQGTKHWVLMHPRLGAAIGGFYSNMELGGYQNAAKAFTNRPLDLQACTPSLETEMNPGDLLWIPPWWWHEVTNKNTGWNFGFSLRLRNPSLIIQSHLRRPSGFPLLFFAKFLGRYWFDTTLSKDLPFEHLDFKHDSRSEFTLQYWKEKYGVEDLHPEIPEEWLKED